jgi:dihydroxy-acid dehydratase
MVRISDARMSGTAFGTIVLHVSPEAAIGGPLGLVRNGDQIELSIAKQRLNLLITEDEMTKRRSQQGASAALALRGYGRLYQQSVMQAEHGCDLDFLRAVGPTL